MQPTQTYNIPDGYMYPSYSYPPTPQPSGSGYMMFPGQAGPPTPGSSGMPYGMYSDTYYDPYMSPPACGFIYGPMYVTNGGGNGGGSGGGGAGSPASFAYPHMSYMPGPSTTSGNSGYVNPGYGFSRNIEMRQPPAPRHPPPQLQQRSASPSTSSGASLISPPPTPVPHTPASKQPAVIASQAQQLQQVLRPQSYVISTAQQGTGQQSQRQAVGTSRAVLLGTSGTVDGEHGEGYQYEEDEDGDEDDDSIDWVIGSEEKVEERG